MRVILPDQQRASLSVGVPRLLAMADSRLSVRDRELFLAEPHIAALSVSAGRFTLMVERVAPTVRYVSVEGPTTRTIPGTDELLREITVRYLPPEKVPAYLEFARTELGEQVAIYLRPQRWLSADLGPG